MVIETAMNKGVEKDSGHRPQIIRRGMEAKRLCKRWS